MIRPYKVSTVEKGVAVVTDRATNERVGCLGAAEHGGWDAYLDYDDVFAGRVGLMCRTRDEAAQLLWDFVNA